MATKTPEELALETLNASGFPFQLAVERRIEDTVNGHEWRVLPRELPWWNEDGRSGFLDLVLQKERYRATVECKRVGADARWVFLADEDARHRGIGRFITSAYEAGHQAAVAMELAPRPPLHESEFCAIKGTGEGDRSTIERLSGQLIEATQSLAQGDANDWERRNVQDEWIYIPILVTNASLWVCRVSGRRVPLGTGYVPSDAPIEPVEAVWFHRTLVADRTLEGERLRGGLESMRRASERTVLVVRATGVATTLTQLSAAGAGPREWLRRRLAR
jgi:hypothetical protein